MKRFLSNRKQYIEIEPTVKLNLEHLKCGVCQGSTLAHLFFLLYVNDLKIASSLLDPI